MTSLSTSQINVRKFKYQKLSSKDDVKKLKEKLINNVSDYLSQLNISDKLEYIRSVENTYPVESNLKQVKNLNNIYTAIENLVLGQFIMIEQIITGKTITEDYLVDFEILKLLIRPLKHEEFDNSDLSLEKENEERILNMDVREAYWYNIVRMLSGEDIHKYEKTYMLPMSVVLPEMSFLAQKNKIESANQRQEEAMRKL